METFCKIFLITFGIIIILITPFQIGFGVGQQDHQIKCIKAGVGEMVITNKITGETDFVFITNNVGKN